MYRPKSTDVWFNLPGVQAAYQPIVAPDPLAARQNVAHNGARFGVYTATPGVLPTWSASEGLKFDGTQYLKTGIVDAATEWSGLARFSWNGVGVQFVWGEYQTGKVFGNYLHSSGWWYLNGNDKNKLPASAAGVIGQSGITGYRNGLPDLATNSGFAGASNHEIGLGGTGLGAYKLIGTIPCVLIASRTLSPAEMWLASHQMAYCEVNPDWNAWARKRNYYYDFAKFAISKTEPAPAPISVGTPIGVNRPKSTDVWFNLPGVVAAYQPIVAPDPLAARQNVAHNGARFGVYTATPGVLPTWSAATGWGFLAASTQYLDTKLVPKSGWSALIRIRQAVTGFAFGEVSTGANFAIRPMDGASVTYNNSGNLGVLGTQPTGVLGISGENGYRNGINEGGSSSAWTGSTTYAIHIGAVNTGSAVGFFTGNILVFAICSRTLSPAEMWLASRQMAYCHVNPDWNAWARRRRYYYAPSAAVAGRVGIYGRRGAVALPGGVSIGTVNDA